MLLIHLLKLLLIIGITLNSWQKAAYPLNWILEKSFDLLLEKLMMAMETEI